MFRRFLNLFILLGMLMFFGGMVQVYAHLQGHIMPHQWGGWVAGELGIPEVGPWITGVLSTIVGGFVFLLGAVLKEDLDTQ